MKKTILILSASFVFVFVACKQKSAQTDLNNYPDTSAYNYPVNDYKTQPSTTNSGTYNTRATKPVYHRTRYTSSSSYAAHTTVTRKKGWSRAAKGAVIGAGSGAVLGAAVSGDHNRVKGAVIGGVVGAAGGYLYGRHRDKKHRRY